MLKFKLNELIDALKEDGYNAVETSSIKNGVDLKAVTVAKGEGIPTPLIYVNDLDALELKDAIKICEHIFNAGMPKFPIEPNQINVDYIKGNVLPLLCHKKRTANLYHENAFADIEATFFLKVGDEYVVKITQVLVDSLGINEPILPYAIENLRGLTSVKTMRDVLQEMANKFGEEIPDDLFEGQPEMLIISTDFKEYGASAILIEKDNLQDGTIILPASIHEIIALQMADDDIPNVDELLDMVVGVNSDVVTDIDILSDNVYIIKDGKICELKEVA